MAAGGARARTTEAKQWHRGAAYHEAGHAVLAVLVGGAVDHILIQRAGDHRSRGGHAIGWPPPDCTPIGALTGRIAVLRAGELAFAKYTGNLAMARGGAEWDDADIAAALASCGLPENVKVDVERQANTIATYALKLLWPAVKAVAETLLFAGRIDGDQVHAILTRVRGPGLDELHGIVQKLCA